MQPSSRNNRVRAVSIRPISPPPAPPPATDGRRMSPEESSHLLAESERLRGSTPETHQHQGHRTEGLSAPLQQPTMTQMVLDEIDETTGKPIVLDVYLPPDNFTLVNASIVGNRSLSGSAEARPALTGCTAPPAETEALLNDEDDGIVKEKAPLVVELVQERTTWKEWWIMMKPGLLVAIFVLVGDAGKSLSGTLLPYLLTDYYGTPQLGARVQTIADATRAFSAMLVVPIYGNLLDSIGRYPFFVLNAVLTLLPAAFIVAAPTFPLAALIASEVSQLTSTTYRLAYLSDHYPDARQRGKIFAITLGVSNFSALISIVGAFVTMQTAAWIGWVFLMVRVPFACFGFSESLDSTQRKPFHRDLILKASPLAAIRAIGGNRVLVLTTLITVSLMIAAIGATEILPYYLQSRVQLQPKDSYFMGLESALLGPLVMIVLYPVIAKHVRPSRIVSICFITLILSILTLILLYHKWELFAVLMPLVSFVNLGSPALLGIFSQAGDGSDQGRRLAGVVAIIDLVTAIVPLVAGQVFAVLPPDMSWVIFVGALAFALPGLVVCHFLLPRWIATDRINTLSRSLGAAPADLAEPDPIAPIAPALH